MTIHIEAEPQDIASTVLLPGDPLRAKYLAENFLEDARRYNNVRGMLGYTGFYAGRRVSVQGSGMGMASIGIYAHELIHQLGARRLIRIGSCGAFHKHLEPRQLILAQAASTDSQRNKLALSGCDFAPVASFPLLLAAHAKATELGIATEVGGILSSDQFYHDDPESWKRWADYGVLGVEMEASCLYTLAAKAGVEALAILTVSDNLVTGASLSSAEREQGLTDMMEVALSLIVE